MSRAARVDGAARSADGGNDGVGGGADILCDAVGLDRVGSEHVGRAARGGAQAVAVVCTAFSPRHSLQLLSHSWLPTLLYELPESCQPYPF